MCGESRTHSSEGVVEGRSSTTTLQFRKVKTRVVGYIQRVPKLLTPSSVSPSVFRGGPIFRWQYTRTVRFYNISFNLQ